MGVNFQEVGIENIEQGKAKDLINEYLRTTAEDLDKMSRVHKVEKKKLRGKVTVNIYLQPLNDLDDHYSISTEVTRTLPKIINHSIASKDLDGGGLFVQDRGSDDKSPYQTTIDNFIEDEERGEIVDKTTGEVISISKRAN